MKEHRNAIKMFVYSVITISCHITFMFKSKVILIGDSGVGKTALMCRFLDQKFTDSSVSTSSAVFVSKSIDVGCETVDLEIWDTAGQEVYRSLMAMYYRGANTALLCFTKEKVNTIREWIKILRDHEPHCTIILVLTKCDLYTVDDIDYVTSEVKEIQNEVTVREFVVTSANTGVGVQIPFELAAKCTPRVQKIIEMEKNEPHKTGCCS